MARVFKIESKKLKEGREVRLLGAGAHGGTYVITRLRGQTGGTKKALQNSELRKHLQQPLPVPIGT